MLLSDVIKTVFLVGVGAVAKTAECSKGLIDELVQKGELTAEEGRVLNEELKHRNETKKNDALLGSVEKLSPEARAALRAKLDEVEAAAAAEAAAPQADAPQSDAETGV